MRVAFCGNNLRTRNKLLIRAFEQGLLKHGDKIIVYAERESRCKPKPKENIRINLGVIDTKQCEDGVQRFVLDKGYDRRKLESGDWIYWSIKYMEDWPETRLLCNAPHDRINTLKQLLATSRKPQNKNHVITLALSSQKYCIHHDLGDAHKYAKGIIEQLKTSRIVLYRPKPTFAEARPIVGTLFDKRKGRKNKKGGGLPATLNKTHVLITHGSSVAANAVIAGVPAITLGGGIAYGVTSHTLDNLENPYWPSERERYNWFADIGYSHYKLEEIESGLAWEVMKLKLQ